MRFSFLYTRRFCLLSMLMAGSLTMYAQKMRIQGRIMDDNKRPLAGAVIVDKATREVLGAADDDGLYSVLVSKTQVLVFESIGCSDKVINVNGQQVIDVVLEADPVKLPDVEVLSKITHKVIPEPTDIEIKGNYFHLKTRVRVPKEMAKSNTRMIFQPYIANVTAKNKNPLRPLVLDGREYTITQRRMYEGDLNRDPLKPYLLVHKDVKNSDLLLYQDSIYIKELNHDYRGEVLISMEDYNHVFYRDSFIIANGTVNPLRFFQYELPEVCLDETDFIPKPALQLRADKGEVELVFMPNKATIDFSIPKNVEEVNRLKERLQAIEADPNANLQAFEIYGVASPDGSLASNEVLAKQRMEMAANAVLGHLSHDTRQFLKISSDASVATWQDVIALMEKDGRQEAQELRKIVVANPKDINRQGRLIRRLKFYKELVAKTYLPQLRRVEYKFDYSIFRSLNNDEILELYNSNSKQLTRYEFYRMFEMTQDTAKLRGLYEEALELYPKFLLAANRLAVLNLSQKCGDETVLEPFIKEDAPQAVIMNQILTLLQTHSYAQANELLKMVPLSSETKELHGIVGIFNGDYNLGYETIAAKGGINEVVLLLAMKKNQEAYDKAIQLPSGIAANEYVKAIAANRLDKVGEAIMYLENAFSLDPHLREVASIDGDVNDLL